MTTERHTVVLTLVIDFTNAKDSIFTACEHLENLIKYGTFRDSLSDAGLDLVRHQVAEPERPKRAH